MGVLKEKDKMVEWRYIIDGLIFTFKKNKGVIKNIPIERVVGMSIEENYDDYYYPFFKLTLSLNKDDIYTIIENRKDLLISLIVRGNTRIKGSKEWSDKKTKYLDDTFEVIMERSDENVLNALEQEKSKLNLKKKKNEDDILDNEAFINIDLYLYKPIVGGMKTIINKVFTDVTIADVIAYIMGKGGVKALYMAQPTNSKKYKQLLIPPMPLMRALEFIDMYYGIYKFGSLIWFGFKKTYVKPYTPDCTVWDKGEKKVTNIIIPKGPNSKIGNFTGELKRKPEDKNNNYIVATYDTLGIVDQAIVNNYITSNEVEMINKESGDTTKFKSKASSKKENYVQILEDNTENSYVSETYAMQTLSESLVVSVDVGMYDLRFISPNKKFNLIFEDSKYTKKYNGAYVIASAVHTFNKKEKNTFYPTSRMIFKRLK